MGTVLVGGVLGTKSLAVHTPAETDLGKIDIRPILKPGSPLAGRLPSRSKTEQWKGLGMRLAPHTRLSFTLDHNYGDNGYMI